MPDLKKSLAPLIGLVAIFAFGWFANYLMHHLGDGEPNWSRAVYVFGGVEAVAFAAFGFFFGKEVHRERAEKAEADAALATKQAQTAVGDQKTAEARLSDLNTIIQKKKNRKAGMTLSDLLGRHLAKEPEIAAEYPGFSDYVRDKGASSVALDPDWDDLATIAEALARDPNTG